MAAARAIPMPGTACNLPRLCLREPIEPAEPPEQIVRQLRDGSSRRTVSQEQRDHLRIGQGRFTEHQKPFTRARGQSRGPRHTHLWLQHRNRDNNRAR